MEFKKTTGYLVFSTIKRWKIFVTLFLFDLLFAVCLFAFAKLFDTFFAAYETQIVGSILGYVLLLVYFLALVFAHSFFKYCLFDVFDEINALHICQEHEEKKTKKTRFSFAFLGRFYLYNLSIYGVLGLVFFALYLFFAVSLVTVLKQPAIVLLILLFGVGGYLFVQFSHLVFFKNKEIPFQEIPKTIWLHITGKKIGNWISWNLFFVAIFFVLYFILFLGVSNLAQKAATDPNAFTLFYVLNVVIFVLLVLFCYFLLTWNRIYLLLRFAEAT